MIKATELRIGNIVSSNKRPVIYKMLIDNENLYKVLAIGLEVAVLQQIGEITGFEEYHSLYTELQPVHLTPAIIEQCGFVRDGENEKWYLLYKNKTSNFFPSLYTYANRWFNH